jgi:hypothetical protein
MEEKNERVWLSTQLICMLRPLPLKVCAYIMNWQNKPELKYYPKQMTKLLHLTEQEVEVAIQTLITHKLLTVRKDGDTWILKLNKEVIKKYYDINLQVVHDHDVLPLDTDVKWNKEETSGFKEGQIDGMTGEQMEAMIKELQVRLEQHKQVQQMIKTASAAQKKEPAIEYSDLPF